MELETKLGTFAIDEAEIINFPAGILGFSEYRRYAIVGQKDSVFSLLQSIDDPELSFVIIMPELVCCEYSVHLSEEDIELLQMESPEDGKVYGIVTIPENVAEMTVNLQAPVVVNAKNLVGAQLIIQGEKYHTKHNVIAEMHKNAYLMQKQGEAEDKEEKIQESV